MVRLKSRRNREHAAFLQRPDTNPPANEERIMNDLPELLTVGRLARLLDQPEHRIRYLLETRNIEPRARAGGKRVYDKTAMARLRYELNRLDARKGASNE